MSHCIGSNGRGYVTEIVAKGKPRVIQLAILRIENNIAECERFYPWPALIQSWKADIEQLKAALKEK